MHWSSSNRTKRGIQMLLSTLRSRSVPQSLLPRRGSRWLPTWVALSADPPWVVPPVEARLPQVATFPHQNNWPQTRLWGCSTWCLVNWRLKGRHLHTSYTVMMSWPNTCACIIYCSHSMCKFRSHGCLLLCVTAWLRDYKFTPFWSNRIWCACIYTHMRACTHTHSVHTGV